MRPVNLIPPDLRRGDSAPLRTGPLAYMLLGALVLALAGVMALVLTNNQIADRKAEVAQLQHEDAAAQAQARRLAAYTQFQAMSEQRVATVTSLANSRFDWERVMRELSLILPDDVWLVSLDASAGGDAGGESSGGSGLSEAGGDGGGEDCRTRSFIASFNLTVAFDGAPAPLAGSTSEAAPPVTGEGGEEGSDESSEGEEAAPEGEGG